MRALVTILLLAAALPAAVAGDEAAEEAARKRAEAAVERFREEFRADEAKKRVLALVPLAEVDHEIVVDAVARYGLRDASPEVRQIAAQVLGRLTESRIAAGRALAAHLGRKEDSPDVLVGAIRSLGKLEYKGARKEIEKVFMKRYRDPDFRWVTVEVMRVFGTMKDVRALPFLLRIAEYQGKTKRGEAGPEVYSKEGSAKAKEEYDAKYGDKADPYGGADSLARWWEQELWNTIEILTGHEFEDTLAFRKWLKENRKKLGLDRPGKKEE
jgi:hypothetical protein